MADGHSIEDRRARSKPRIVSNSHPPAKVKTLVRDGHVRSIHLVQSGAYDVTVRAELSAPYDPEISLSQGASVASIAPGQVQVVRFSRLGAIPYHQSYHLEVTVDAVSEEQNLADNFRAFDIEIQQ